MSIELDWQIVDEDAPPPDGTSSPSSKPHRTKRVLWIAFAIVALAAASVAVYSAWVYRAGLAQASEQVRLVARLESQRPIAAIWIRVA